MPLCYPAGVLVHFQKPEIHALAAVADSEVESEMQHWTAEPCYVAVIPVVLARAKRTRHATGMGVKDEPRQEDCSANC